jgi:hypothetical protein
MRAVISPDFGSTTRTRVAHVAVVDERRRRELDEERSSTGLHRRRSRSLRAAASAASPRLAEVRDPHAIGRQSSS